MPTIKILAPRSFTDVENSDFNPIDASVNIAKRFKAHGYEVEIVTYGQDGLGQFATGLFVNALMQTMAMLVALDRGEVPTQDLIDGQMRQTARFLALTGNGTLQGTAEKEQG